MKLAICVCILVFAPILGHAQVTATANKPHESTTLVGHESSRSSDADNQQSLTAALLHSYATSVNDLLSNLAIQLQAISQHAAAGELTQQNALLLKFAATQTAIARLEALSAVYDSQLVSKADDNNDGDGLDSSGSTLSMLRLKGTVTVKELQREASRCSP